MGSERFTHRCACGAEFRYPPELAGRTGACKKCGVKVTLPHGSPIDEPDGAYGLDAAEIKPPRATTTPLPTPMSARIAREGRTPEQPDSDDRPSFWADAAKGFMFWTRPGDLANVVMVAGVLALATIGAPFLDCLGLVVMIGAYGMVAGYLFSVIVYSASESDDLPNPFEFEGLIESVLAPLMKLFVVSLAISAPALATQLLVEDSRIVTGVLIVSYFLWPAAMLIAALGGVFTAFRLDYVMRTIVSSFVPYLGIWIMLLAGFAASNLAQLSGFASLDAVLGEVLPLWVAVLLATTVSVTMWVITMRTIGLYYRHYSDRFPWSAG